MPLPLRITFNNEDYSYKIVSALPPNKDCTELELLVNGEPVSLIRMESGWLPKEEYPDGLHGNR